MTTLGQLLRTLRRGAVVAAVGVLAGAALVGAAPGVSAAGATAVNCSTMDLQSAIDSASPGATLAVSGTCSGNYTVNEDLNLSGQGTAVLDGQQGGTALTVSSNATVQVSGLTITDGNAGSAGNGGGIDNSGTLTLVQSTVSHSAASFGGGIYNSGTLTLKDSTVRGNSSSIFGGGIYNNGMMTLAGTSVSNNSATDSGGGIFTGFGFSPVILKDSTISGNTAFSGAGIFNILDTATLNNVTVTANTATFAGGGINNNAGTTTLNDSTVADNTVQTGDGGSPGTYGGGVYNFSGIVTLNNSTVSRNVPDNCDPSGTVTSCTG